MVLHGTAQRLAQSFRPRRRAPCRAIAHPGCLRVIERRFRRAGGEIDLIAVDDDGVLIFVEVKARRSDCYGSPLESVDRRKQRRLVRAARAFLREYERSYRSVRFDVVALLSDGRGRLLHEWVRDAFRI